MITNKDTLKKWFKNLARPTENQFANWIDSYWHKEEELPVTQISGLKETLDKKAERSAFEEHLKDVDNPHEILEKIEVHNTNSLSHQDIRQEIEQNRVYISELQEEQEVQNERLDIAEQNITKIEEEQIVQNNNITSLDTRLTDHAGSGTAHKDIRDEIVSSNKRISQNEKNITDIQKEQGEQNARLNSAEQKITKIEGEQTVQDNNISSLNTRLTNHNTDSAAHGDIRQQITGLESIFNSSNGHDHDGTNSKKIDYSNLLNRPASLPASDVYPWAKQPAKPAYTAAEVGAAAASHSHTADQVGAAPSSHTHTRSQISDFPASLPASDVYSWAKQQAKPTYTAAEVGAAAASHTHTAGQVGAAPSSHTHTRSQISDFPASLPASDVYSWAKQPTKPAYTAAEVGAAAASHSHTAAQVGAAAANHTHTAAQVGAAAASHNHTRSQITDFPTSLPANGGNSATVGGYTLRPLTQAEYNAISAKDSNTFYFIYE